MASRALGNNEAHAWDDIDELLETQKRWALELVSAHYMDDDARAGQAATEILKLNTLAGRIAVMARTGNYSRAAAILPEHDGLGRKTG